MDPPSQPRNRFKDGILNREVRDANITAHACCVNIDKNKRSPGSSHRERLFGSGRAGRRSWVKSDYATFQMCLQDRIQRRDSKSQSKDRELHCDLIDLTQLIGQHDEVAMGVDLIWARATTQNSICAVMPVTYAQCFSPLKSLP